MKIACVSFTQYGDCLAETIKKDLPEEVDIFSKSTYKEALPGIFKEYDGIVFISSTGIAVRLSAPFLISKAHDPAIVVIDDTAKFSISLVSGHLGGANELAKTLAELLECQPVITTASDNRGIEAVDLFAKRHQLVIEDMDAVKHITAMMVDGKRIGFYSPFPEKIDYTNLVRNHPEGCIFVDSAEKIDCAVPYCLLRPKVLHVGIGCRQGKSSEDILDAIQQVFRINNLSLKSIQSLATIELKKDEPGIKQACKVLECQLTIFPVEQIHTIEKHFEQSDFVRETTGVGAVSEPCAVLSGGNLIVNKQMMDGITIAVAKKD
ncbi:MAG: cobalt-precorrin 5A hydrolase [Proteobacteria bacterium]|nr:cobalt-precorrin 5A hydrolase [Pseudomonadota bacterium]